MRVLNRTLVLSLRLFLIINFPWQTSCVLTYDGSHQAVGGIYAVALTLEDFPAGTIKFGSVTPFSGIPLQFLVMVIGNHAGNWLCIYCSDRSAGCRSLKVVSLAN